MTFHLEIEISLYFSLFLPAETKGFARTFRFDSIAVNSFAGPGQLDAKTNARNGAFGFRRRLKPCFATGAPFPDLVGSAEYIPYTGELIPCSAL